MVRTLLLSLVCVALAVTGKANAQPNVDFYGDALLDHAIARLGTTRFRHNGSIRDLRLITAERSGEVLIYETATGKHLVTVPAHNQSALAIAMSADGQRLLSVGTDQTGIVWDFPALLKNQ